MHYPVPTKDLEVNGGILLSSLVLRDADVFSLVIFIHIPDGQLRAVVTEDVLLVIFLLILYGFPIPTQCRNAKGEDSEHGVKRFISGHFPLCEGDRLSLHRRERFLSRIFCYMLFMPVPQSF